MNSVERRHRFKSIDLSINGWVGGSGVGQSPLKKTMHLKSILGQNKPF